MAVPNIFGTATAAIPLSQLDSNFATTITLGNTAIQLGNTVTTLNNMTLANVTVSSGSVTLTNITATTANVTTANISGTTTLTNLTASTALSLDASKNIASVTNTGTGNNVLATSPTFVTPALGTPSSGVVTNLTGTASININGTVGATTASTGAFTTLSATGVTTVQAGTAALPAITTTGDTDTGIYYPAANQVAISTGGTQAMLVDASQNVTFAQAANLPNTFGFKNRIINGAMVIDQRNAGASITPTDGQYSVDRFQGRLNVAGKFTLQQNAAAVTPPAGFINYLGATSTSAYSIGASETCLIVQAIEGLNVADLGWGSASAATVTLSFWVRSSLTGTFSGALQNSAGNRSYPFTFTISSANTWEQKTITVAGDTSGTWLTTNGVGISLRFNLGSGSTFLGTADAWAASGLNGATGSVSVVGTNGATFYITGVQLEKGSTATSFDYRSIGTELALCQRYFVKTNPSNDLRVGGMWGTTYTSGLGNISGLFPVPMRAAPTFTTGGTYNSFYMSNVSATSAGTFVNLIASTTCFNSEISGMSASSVGHPIQYNGQLSIAAEL